MRHRTSRPFRLTFPTHCLVLCYRVFSGQRCICAAARARPSSPPPSHQPPYLPAHLDSPLRSAPSNQIIIQPHPPAFAPAFPSPPPPTIPYITLHYIRQAGPLLVILALTPTPSPPQTEIRDISNLRQETQSTRATLAGETSRHASYLKPATTTIRPGLYNNKQPRDTARWWGRSHTRIPAT